MAKTLPPRVPNSFSYMRGKDPFIARREAARAIARSLNRQINTARMLLETAERFPTYEASHDRFVQSSARVLRHAETQLWQVEIEQADLTQLASSVETLWFAIDALS